eukprot:s1320_g9.t1
MKRVVLAALRVATPNHADGGPTFATATEPDLSGRWSAENQSRGELKRRCQDGHLNRWYDLALALWTISQSQNGSGSFRWRFVLDASAANPGLFAALAALSPSAEMAEVLLRSTKLATAGGLRKICEESLLSTARLVRAFGNLDRALPAGSAAEPERAPQATSKARAGPERSRSPRRDRDQRPPLPRTSPGQSERPQREPSSDELPEADYGDDEEDADRYDRAWDHRSSPPRSHRGRDERPPEPPGPPPRREKRESGEHHKSRKKRSAKKATRRGGARHQKRSKDLEDPLRISHRRLRPEQVALARSFREGLERRY